MSIRIVMIIFNEIFLIVAFSSSVKGVGVVAGGPYYCARGDFGAANANCMKVASMIGKSL